MATAADQCNGGFLSLQAYFKGLSKYYSDGVTLPDYTTLYTSMPIEELLTYTVQNSSNSASFSIGAGVEAIQHFTGVDRELGMSESGKTAIYISAISEHNQESSFYGQNAAFLSGVMRGSTTNGSQC